MSNQSLARRAATVIIAVYEQAEHELKDLRAKSDESLWLADTLLQIEAHLGHHEEMAHEAEDLIEQTKRDQWRFPVTETVLARAYVIADDVDHALPLLDHALSVPAETSVTVANLRLDPVSDRVRDDPRFQKLANNQR